MKTNQEITKANLNDRAIIKEIAQMMQLDINGSRRENEKLEEYLMKNTAFLEKCQFSTYNGLKYKNEEAYDAMLDLIEENGLA